MKLQKIALAAAIACVSYAGNAFAAEPGQIRLVSGCASSCAADPCGCGQPVCGCETALGAGGCADAGCAGAGCDGGCASGCGGGCDSAGCGLADRINDCCLEDPWTLFGEHCGWSAGGWIQTGYHSKGNGLFNSRPDEFNLHQAWLYAEKAADGSNGLGLGGRIDYVYGIDAQDTQAFGTDPRGWDNSWDNGAFGNAIPQLYGEAAYGDLSVKFGHFFTIIGWEVVPATGNFFYSHAYTMYNSEPFTHTGVLSTYNVSDDLSVWGGYTMGWDSGFDDNGDNFLGGFSASLTDKLTMIYATAAGRFGEARFNGVEQGYMHSIIADYAISDDLQFIMQSDLLDTEDAAGAPVRETFGLNHYLIKTINDCWAVGGRFEWWNVERNGGGDNDVFALTLGVNHKRSANLMVRPEIRWDWDDAAVNGLEDGEDQFTFGMDTIFTF